MSPKLPVVSGEQLIRALQRFGYVSVRQKGSHVRLRHETNPARQPVTIPLHSQIAPGTLRRILRDTQVSTEQLVSVL
jgi:predicted RNA binding protein YcfA (HicA-like mRNA interferase family)